MVSKCIFIACLFASAAIAAKIPSRIGVNRDQPLSNEDIKLSHDDVPGIRDSNLKIQCGEDGGVSFTLSTLNPTMSATIAVSQSQAVPAIDECKSPAFIFPLAEDASAVFALTSVQGDTCGRTFVPADSVTGPAHFSWWVVVKENIKVNAVSVRSFSSEINVACAPKLAEPVAPGFDQNPDLSVNEGDASFIQDIGFSLEKSATLVDKKWQFTLKPNTPSSLAGSNFKIVSCKATPENEDMVVAELITNRCISDLGTTVDASTSPTAQVITIHPFQFSDFPIAKVLLSCSVELCSNVGESNCGEILACAAPSPSEKRTRRSLNQLYFTTTV